MAEIDLTAAVEAAQDEFHMLVEQDLVEQIVRVVEPIIERAVRVRDARMLLAEAERNETHVTALTQWDAGFARGLERAAHFLANEADRADA